MGCSDTQQNAGWFGYGGSVVKIWLCGGDSYHKNMVSKTIGSLKKQMVPLDALSGRQSEDCGHPLSPIYPLGLGMG